MEPLEVQRRYVPHFEGLIYGKVEPEAQGHDSTFTFCHAHLKKAILLLKMAKSPVFLQGTVYTILLTNTNPVVSDSGATLKFQFSSLKNISHTDFQLNFSTPGILVAIRSTGKKLQEYITGVNGFQKFLCVVDLHEKTDF